MNTSERNNFSNYREGMLLNTASSKQNKESGKQSIAHRMGQSVGQSVEKVKQTESGNRGCEP